MQRAQPTHEPVVERERECGGPNPRTSRFSRGMRSRFLEAAGVSSQAVLRSATRVFYSTTALANWVGRHAVDVTFLVTEWKFFRDFMVRLLPIDDWVRESFALFSLAVLFFGYVIQAVGECRFSFRAALRLQFG